jgi:hypothetical protein
MAERIEVISVFRQKTVRPVKFKYAGRVHVVSKILYSWMTREGSFPVHNFSVLTEDGERFALSLNTYTMDWTISCVDEAVVGQ